MGQPLLLLRQRLAASARCKTAPGLAASARCKTLAAPARCKTAPGDVSAARTPDGVVAVFADTAAVPVERFAASDNAVD